MKHITPLLIFLAFSLALAAQKHSLKANLPSAVMRNISLSYEYFLKPNLSLQLQAGFYPYQKTQPPFLNLSFGEFISQTQMKPTLHTWGMTLTPEIRIYTSQKQTYQGFFYAPYLRFFNYQFTTQSGFTLYEPEIGTVLGRFTFAGKGHYYAIRPGFQVGYKWTTNKHFCIEIFSGVNMGIKGANMKVLILESQTVQAAEIQALLHGSAPIFGKSIISIQDDTHYNVKASQISTGLRSGINMGFTF